MNRNTKYLRCVISIHSARVGGDLNCKALFHPLKNFNPLRPCGRRQQGNVRLHLAIKISIHSARVGGDSSELSSKCNSSIFQSTPPVWAETCMPGHKGLYGPMDFNPLRPCGRRQQKKPFFRLLSISITTYFTEKSKRTRCKFSHLGYLFQYSLLILVRTSLYVDV